MPYLGEKSHILLNVTDLKNSLHFYQKLGFKTLDKREHNDNWALLTDQAIFLMLYEDEVSSAALTYFAPDIENKISALQQQEVAIDHIYTDDEGQSVIQAVMRDPNQLPVNLVKFNPSGLPDIDLNQDTRCGIFGEFVVHTGDLEESLDFWKKLNHQVLQHSSTPYPHALISDGTIIIGLHQNNNEEHKKALLTYFAPDMHNRLNGLRLENVSIKEEQKNEKGVTIQAAAEAPDGERIYLFKGSLESSG